jgi:hypothetical protein
VTPTQQLLIWIYVATIAIWPIRHLALWLIFRKLIYLTRRSPRFEAPRAPLVSAIIPAKDEEGTLAECLHSVCAQSYPNLEILVVDDRSTDRTAAIAREFAERDPRVRLISITDLPTGWTGKTHALEVAARAARGDWFWFLDSDTRHHPDCLAIVLEMAHSEDAALASLVAELRCDSFWERVVQPLAGIMLMQSFPLFLVNDDRSKRAFANGQFILIHRPAYEAAGGHASVRDRFVEDIYLAKRVKRLGYKIRVAVGPEISSTRMYTSLPQIVRGWSRILYDAAGRRPWPLLGKVLDPLVFSQPAHLVVPAALLLMFLGMPGPFPGVLVGLGIAHHVLAATVLYRLYRLSVANARSVVWYPLAGLVMDWALFRSLRMCLTGRVTWRGTAYGPVPARRPVPAPAALPSVASRL